MGSSFFRAIKEVAPLAVSSLLLSVFVCTVWGLSLSYKSYPVLLSYFLALFLFATFFLTIRVQDEARNKIDCYMQAAVSSVFVALVNCEILWEIGLVKGWLGNPFWEYKLAFFILACFWHWVIMVLLFKSLKNKKAASIRMQPRLENLD